jgi:hypothetical protein
MSQKRTILFAIIGFGISMLLMGIYLAVEPFAPSSANQQSFSNSSPKINRTVTVPSKVMWYDTGIDIPGGATVGIDYKSGRWTNAKGGNYVDGQGIQFNRRDLILPSYNLASLVGKVGGYTFFVGNSYNGNPGSGRLYLSLNDVSGTYNDNDGQLEVSVSIK